MLLSVYPASIIHLPLGSCSVILPYTMELPPVCLLAVLTTSFSQASSAYPPAAWLSCEQFKSADA